ncbi:hypothetical protein GQ43DRAFT_446192 [Delitschia confertaspora ATCC 74209]|uniref:Uncharacterized protein n=1 Tax=Delitschia confertaspora ATCC 74209 TaxID=1513339 RepID=A0A9P4JTE2_9PLEO|nr:hypothetical protein GQ43DRAFT_446192 [Delitschia confertaspora ATCC 74209]
MAFRQHHRPQPSRQLSLHAPERPSDVGALSSPQRKRTLEDSEEWVLFSPVTPSATQHSTSTARTPCTAGLSHLSDFGSLDTAARSDQDDDDDITCQGTEEGEELDSLDDGLHAFHEPSEFGLPPAPLQQSGNTVLPTHDGLGTFQPGTDIQEHLWQFEKQDTRPRHVRRRSSVQRRLDALEEADEVKHEQDRRQRIELWRMEQSRALLEEIEKETRRRRRMSLVSADRTRVGKQEDQTVSNSQAAESISDRQSDQSDENTESLSFWQRLTRRVIKGLMGIDEDTLSVIFGEALPEELISGSTEIEGCHQTIQDKLQDFPTVPGEPWEHRLLERIARELGILVHQLSEHPGAFSTYLRAQEPPPYVGMTENEATPPVAGPNMVPKRALPLTQSQTTPPFAPVPLQLSALHSDASLWGIEEQPESDPLESFRVQQSTPASNAREEIAHEREYWEQELDVKMIFNFLMKRFSSRRSSSSSQSRPSMSNTRAGPATTAPSDAASARRAAVIRQHHPLVNRNSNHLPTSSSSARDTRRKDLLHRHHTHHFAHQQPPPRTPGIRSSSSCASQSTKKSKRSNNSRNYWDLGGSMGSGSVLAAEG